MAKEKAKVKKEPKPKRDVLAKKDADLKEAPKVKGEGEKRRRGEEEKGKLGSKAKVIELIGKMTVLELSELVKELEEKFGVKAAAPVAVGAVSPGQGGAPTEVEEKTEFDVVLKSFGENKIRVIKAVREVTELGLREAKELVDGAPNTVKEKVLKEEAESIQKKLQEAGAVCELK